MKIREYRKGQLRAVVAVMLGALPCTACDLGSVLHPTVDPINNAVATLDQAISRITAISDSWQTVLQDSLKQLTADAQSTVRIELQSLLDHATASAQVGAMCTADFVGRRVVSALEAIKAELLGRQAPTPSPFVCKSTPLAVEFEAWQQSRIPIVELTGFDLKTPLQVQLVQTTGTSMVPDVLANVSAYQATINLGATGLHLTPQSQRIVVSTTAQPPIELTAINVVQPQPKICKEQDLMVELGSIGFRPGDHLRGDREYNGHGPHITAGITIVPVGSRLNYEVFMSAVETTSDWTTVQGSGRGELSISPAVPDDRRIVSIIGSTVSNVDYVDRNKDDDHVSPTNGGPVSEFVFTGDTDGDDVGRTQLVRATFNRVGLHVVETQNCVAASEAKALLESATDLTPQLSAHLQEALKSQ